MDDQTMAHLATAKATAMTYLQEATVWINATPVEYAAFRRLQRAIALELFDQADFTAEQREQIQQAMPIFRPDPAIENMRRTLSAVMATPELQNEWAELIKKVEEAGS